MVERPMVGRTATGAWADTLADSRAAGAGFRHAMTMAFAIDEINKNNNLLPNVTLGYSLYDNCATLVIGFSAALLLASGQEEQFLLQKECLGTPPVLGIVDSMECTSCPEDFWSNVQRDHCIPKKTEFLSYHEPLALEEVGSGPRGFPATVKGPTKGSSEFSAAERQSPNSLPVTGFRQAQTMAFAIDEINRNTNLLPNTPRLMPYIGGTLGIAIRRGEIPGFKDFLLKIRPDLQHNNSYGNSMVNQFWEYTFQCRFAPPHEGWVEAGGSLCTGQEDLEILETEFLDISNLRPEYNVYKAVYALAYALDNMLQCEAGRGPFREHSCGDLQRLEPWQANADYYAYLYGFDILWRGTAGAVVSGAGQEAVKGVGCSINSKANADYYAYLYGFDILWRGTAGAVVSGAGQEAVKGVGCSINSKSKEPTNNYISILEQTLAVRRTPPGTRHCLNALKSQPEPQLSAHKPDK
ncbi:Extracellular calcium-sensing receptor [Liparis tanakae]|uniref:Extracellular calcium-sensing receptor n=1 Tax=Liparis tanakae TaxID=230148 RepID=A0A4Z2HJM9_9TELE|nr:Extracellular calcium-sensing receptor [Liparis tanakae]